MSNEPAPRDWTFTFCDMRTRQELAVLPLTQVKYSKQVSGAGSLDAYLPLTDPRVRALNPWAATRQRKTACFVEYGDRCMWQGPVISRHRGSDSQGLQITGITYEGWLARQRILNDLLFTNVATRDVMRQLIAAVQVTTDVGLTVQNGDPGQLRNWAMLAREVKPATQLIDDLAASALTFYGGDLIEYRVDAARDANGVFQPVFVLGEPRIGRRFETTNLTYAYPDGGLQDWQFPEDGSGANNVMPYLGSGMGDYQPFSVLYDTDAGASEIASGFPSWMNDFRASDASDLGYVKGRAMKAMRQGFASETVFEGVKPRAARYLADAVDMGDDVALEVNHISMETYPQPVTWVTRVLGETVTVGYGGKGDTVELTVGGVP